MRHPLRSLVSSGSLGESPDVHPHAFPCSRLSDRHLPAKGAKNQTFRCNRRHTWPYRRYFCLTLVQDSKQSRGRLSPFRAFLILLFVALASLWWTSSTSGSWCFLCSEEGLRTSGFLQSGVPFNTASCIVMMRYSLAEHKAFFNNFSTAFWGYSGGKGTGSKL